MIIRPITEQPTTEDGEMLYNNYCAICGELMDGYKEEGGVCALCRQDEEDEDLENWPNDDLDDFY